MTENKRFIVIDDGLDFMVRDTFTGDDLIDADGVADVLNDYEKENEQLKAVMKELRDMLQSDVDNGVRTYPITLLEYLISALQKIGDFE